MKSIQINYNDASQTIKVAETASPEFWDAVCKRFDNDVRRIKAVSDQQPYTAVYACYDENNQPVYYLVEESRSLKKMRQKIFLSKLGQFKT